MKTFVKSTLLAATLTALGGSAVAGTLTVTSQTHSLEGIVGVTTAQSTNSIAYTLGAAYAVGDTINFAFNADVVANTSFPSQINVEAVDSATPADAIAGLALGFLNSDDTSATYRVTAVNQPDDTPGDGGTPYSDRTTIGAVATLGAVSFIPANLASGDVTIAVSSETSNSGPLDTDANGTLATAKTQFGSAAIGTPFDNVIDVSAERKAFTPEAPDTVSWSISNPDTTGWSNLATVDATNGTVFALMGEDGKLSGLASGNFTVAGGGTVTYTEETETVSTSYNGDVTSDTLTFTAPTGDGAVILNAQSFTATVTYNYTSAGGTAASKVVGTGLEAGAWTINGAVVVIPYMPYSTSASQIIYLTNTGTQSGNVNVTAFELGGTAYNLGTLGTTVGGQMMKLGPAILTALQSAGFSGSGKMTITITAEVPKADIIVYASYNVGGADRGFVNTDQFLPK